jgi:hypothetical protein
MSDGTTLIQSSLKLIGAHSIYAPADAESIEVSLGTLNSMLQLWLSQGIELNISPLNAVGEEVGEPLDTRQAIINNLAVMLAPNFGIANVPNQLKVNANLSYIAIKALYQVFTVPDKVVSSTLPRGAGNNRGRSSRVYAGAGATIASSDA